MYTVTDIYMKYHKSFHMYIYECGPCFVSFGYLVVSPFSKCNAECQQNVTITTTQYFLKIQKEMFCSCQQENYIFGTFSTKIHFLTKHHTITVTQK